MARVCRTLFFKILWRFRLVARTHASHAWNTGSIPVGATKERLVPFFFLGCMLFWLGHMPLTHYFFRTRVSIPVGATKERPVPFFIVAMTHASHLQIFGAKQKIVNL